MLDPNKDWLPIGSVVRLEGGERLVMVAGYLAIDSENGRIWDYLGYLHPEGNQHDDAVFFQRELVDEVFQLGFMDADGLRLLSMLEEQADELRRPFAQPGKDAAEKQE
jgi:hypothetical protein